jgi:2-dehydro-3-deoxy-D-gluconate 5-dehydrogenase
VSPFNLDGRVALVTGASRGIGAGIALGLAQAGASVVLHSSERPALETEKKIQAAGPTQTRCLTADLSNRAATECLMSDAIGTFGGIDILVNNAGIIRRAPAASYGDEDWDAVLEVDLTSVFRLCRIAGNHMLARGHGKIVNVASLLSFQGGITVPAYAAAKGGVAQLTKALANEWAGKGVNVNAIAPGYIHTDVTRPLQEDPARNRAILERIPAGRWGEPEDLSGAVVFLASRAADYIHGHVLAVDGGWLGR